MGRAARGAGLGAILVSGGLPIRGKLVPVDGLTIIPPASMGGPAWSALTSGDWQPRRARVRQILLHTTKGDWPQYTKAGKGAGGRAKFTFEFWAKDPAHSGAHIVIDNDGTVACGGDLVGACAYEATVSNEYAVGIEMYQESDGGVYEAVYDAAVRLVPALCEALDIPFFVVADPYDGHPLPRFLDGAPDFYGVCGHRNNTEQRGRGDPGDEAFRRLIAAGGEPVNAAARQDVALSKARQAWLNQHGELLSVDGLAGPVSLAAGRRAGFRRWRDVPTA